MLKFLVRQQKIEILEREVIASDQISFVTLKFIFEGDWKNFYKVVQFTQDDETYNRVLGFDGLSCLMPAELHAGAVNENCKKLILYANCCTPLCTPLDTPYLTYYRGLHGYRCIA